MNDQNLNNYHWTNMNVSEWAKEQINTKIAALGYTITDSAVEALLNNRMNKLGLVYFLSVRAQNGEKWLRLSDFDNYCEASDVLGSDRDDAKQFFEFLKGLEEVAICTFSGKQHTDPGHKFEKRVDHDFKISASAHGRSGCAASTAQKVPVPYHLNIEFATNCSAEEFINFLTNPSFVAAWTGNQFSVSGKDLRLFDRATFRNFASPNGLEFTMSGWGAWTAVAIKGTPKKSIRIQMQNVSYEHRNTAAAFWRSGIVTKICATFGFTFRDVEKE